MKNLAIARRYAKALLLIGKEDGQTETYREELAEFSELIEKETLLEQAINNPLYNAAGGDGAAKHFEFRVGHNWADIRQFQAKADVGVVAAKAIHCFLNL